MGLGDKNDWLRGRNFERNLLLTLGDGVVDDELLIGHQQFLCDTLNCLCAGWYREALEQPYYISRILILHIGSP
jgi:hypothetical protein